MKNSELSTTSRQKIFNLIKEYFLYSDQKLVAWLLLIGAALCVIGLVTLMATFAWWSAGYWTVLTAKELTPFLISMGQFALILGAHVGVFVLKHYFIGKLSILWRNWLTKKIIGELFESENNYLELKRFSSEIDNISQRIQEDVKTFVESTLNLSADFFNSVLSLGTFVGTLWVIGGPLAFTLLGLNIVIPGYLVWVALIAAIAVTAVTHLIGKSLPKANQNVERAEADLRQELVQLNEDAENIAEEHAENYYKTTIENKIQDIKNTTNRKLNTRTKLIAFQNFYFQISGILPTLLAAPLYFAGLIEIGQLMQIGMSFTQVSLSLNWFADSYENLSIYKASINRIIELQKTFEKNGLETNEKLIARKVRNKESLNIKRLNIAQPQASSTQYILRNLNLKLIPGEHILIKGRSGLGKSSLFRSISGTWKYGDGKISIPAGKSFYFLPQKPTLPYDILKAVLAYPECVDTYTEEEYIAALRAVGGMDDFIPRLDEKRPWSKEMSAGQQQRISFARVLLKKPDWLFLDEATSSLDEESEEHVYRAIKELKSTTIVSIAHRSTVEKHHSKIIFFSANEEREIKVKEQTLLGVSF
ncbi:ABC transporter [Legionella lansingensis]|uniref:ABC transporter n=1 Tax=Legionella lansingensis TaxID=45067 RepID=A0A0W0VHK5_9GAMM|nr:ABC transporter ATP-binding protein/permease [Legionella lansingensis]KTD19318.1 ABC transporter [Legionella lansingensis]SNV50415.1 ABC transporter [Legionella lansingensis]